MAPRKKLIEVALPLEAINRESAREKSIRHGHPSTLHLWWARRPLAACRAVLFASLVDDPDSDPAFASNEDRAATKRAELFDLIEELVKWDNVNNPDVLNRARAEIARCVASRKIETGEWAKDFAPVPGATAWDFNTRRARPKAVNALLAEHAPPVYDPFCGGGSIPLEAQRLGLRAYASDLNPVPVLITKALIEIPPKFAGMPPVNPRARARLKTATYRGTQGLTEDVRYYGSWMRDEAEKRIGHLYPKVKVTPEMAQNREDLKPYVGQELMVIAWLWARTVPSPNPAANGAHVPLVRSFWLSTKAGKKAWVEPMIDRTKSTYRFEVRVGSPTKEQARVYEAGTKVGRGCKFRCLLTDQPIPEEFVKSESFSGGQLVRLMAIVAEGARGRVYLPPTSGQERVAAEADNSDCIEGIDSPLAHDPRNLWCLQYGLDHFHKLFTPRQLIALATISDLVVEARAKVQADAINRSPNLDAYATAVATYLALGSSKIADYNSTLVIWSPGRDQAKSTFARQALPMSWDFAEVNPIAKAAGDMQTSINGICDTLERLPFSPIPGTVQQHNIASGLFLSSALIATDPPYYDNISYADLSDFFYVWQRRSLGAVYPDLFHTLLTPKAEELIASPYRFDGSKDKARGFFEERLGRSFHYLRQAEHPDYPLTVYYAFKQSETEEDNEEDSKDGSNGAMVTTVSTGWETMLDGLIKAGFLITGTWPIRTERSVRSVGIGTNALASSIVLVCYPRSTNAPTASRREFLTALKRELPDALRNLQHGNIAPVDLAQASIGPGMAVFSRYAKVVEADGSPMSVRTALQLINQALDEVLSEQEGEFDADTRWAIAWFEQHGMDEGAFGTAETLSKAKNTSVAGLVQARFLSARGGKVRLLRRDELPDDWDPATDTRRTVWEVTQHLILALDREGEQGAAALLRKVGEQGEVARDLAYRLYTTCERKKWAQEALAYNSLVIAWPQIARLALSASESRPQQSELF